MAVTSEADRFRTLYDANHRRVRRLIARIAGPEEAEDLTQAVFARAATALPSFRGDAQASTWLYRIAVNITSGWLRGRSAHEARVTVRLPDVPNDMANEAVLAPSDPRTCPEQELIRKEMNDCIRGVIAQLPDSYRTVLMLGELGGLTDDEVAQTLGISRGNAKVRLHRARIRLKQALEARCDFSRSEDNEFVCEPKAATAAPCPPHARCSSTTDSKC